MGSHDTLRDRALTTLNELSDSRLQVALDFLEYLKEKEEWEATLEILSDPETMAAIREAEEDWENGRMNRFVSLEEVRKRVQGHSNPQRLDGSRSEAG